MNRKISLQLKSGEHIKKTVHFEFPEPQIEGPISNTVCFRFFVEGQEMGFLETSLSDFNDFCLDLSKEHKRIIANR